MVEQTSSPDAGRTLVVLLGMHRSGSSLVTNLLQRLEMSLGPFEVLGASEHNKYGHFEAVPMYRLDQELLERVFGFREDIPDSPEVLRAFCQSEGRWTLEASGIEHGLIERGAELIRQLVDSGEVSGFKDPRVPLLWPFWERVFSGFPDVRVVPVFLARSPHEIAMSIFARGKGMVGYYDALDVTAVHYRRLNAIRDTWQGASALVRFDPRMLPADLRRAADVCGLTWNEDVFSQVYDASCRHQEPARVAHEAQELYERLSGFDGGDAVSPQRLETDAAIRENLLRGHLTDIIDKQRQEIAGFRRKVADLEREALRSRQTESEHIETIARLEHRLALITGSRTWRWRQHLVDASPLKWLANARRSNHGPTAGCDAPWNRVRSRPSVDATTSDLPCTIIIPVYNAFPEAVACVRSVIEHTNARHQVLVVDDCSPAGSFVDMLPTELLGDARLRVVRNERNLGFVKTCNWAMQQAAPSDVVLLNSDTEVTSRWLEKLMQAAASSESVGTVTPLTNNGTVCSIPAFLQDNELPAGCSVEEFAALVEAVSGREYPGLPTCVGFCVYIKRAVIDRIGLFDEEAFGKGYGEENDFSCRAQAAGYVDVLDDATFVYHHGKMSFQAETDALIADHLKRLAAQHPHYSSMVQQYIEANPLQRVHDRIHEALLRRWNAKTEHRVLHVLHQRPMTRALANLPGGIEYHVADLIRRIPEAAHWSLHAAAGEYRLVAHAPGNEREYRAPIGEIDLADLISPELFDVVHVHHTKSLDYEALAEALLRHGRYFVSVHDFRLCCPKINLLTPERRLCNGHECATACGQNPSSMQILRSTTQHVLQNARAVFHFSQSTKDQFAAILPGDYPWTRIEHGTERSAVLNRADVGAIDRPSADVPLKVAFLGGIGVNKGADLIRQLVANSRLPSGVPIEWHLIGLIDGDLDPVVHQHGRYERDDLPAVMNRVSPHVVAILSIWPETYCYTFDESLACGIPVVSTPLGAPAERLKQYRCGWIADSLSVDGVLETLQRVVDDWDQYSAIRRRIAEIPLNDVERVARRYHQFYEEALPSMQDVIRLRRLPPLERFTSAAPSIRRRAVHRAINGGLVVLQAVNARSLATRLAKRLLPPSTIDHLRQWRRSA